MNTNNKIILKENKTLKLNNVLIRELSEKEFMDINRVTYMMESYIKSKGNSIIGPMINYSSLVNDDKGNPKLIVKIIFQLKNSIDNVNEPYEYQKQIKVTNCLFARFNEKEENLQFAYSKLQLHAFENDIKLLGSSYTVFVDKKEDRIVADVFMKTEIEGETIESI
ncbi:hypothetical protein N496_15220 [Clostridium botulinum A2B3 87]|uniref:hypothetical protein n=1 Tax=Clostridium botulinum TaxID=1491 RepID=UPI0004A58CA5|nr:hypothetical protein [Clostridium botulinum]KEI96540.1 hypothetical protein N496_15220 [Clostridium botulinum A2B3 87]